MKKLVVLTGAGMSAESCSSKKIEFIRMKASQGVEEFIKMVL
jgi:hypothetical protein